MFHRPFQPDIGPQDSKTGWTHSARTRHKMPFPILGVESDNGSEFINITLLQWCERHHITFTRARPANKNDGCYVEQ